MTSGENEGNKNYLIFKRIYIIYIITSLFCYLLHHTMCAYWTILVITNSSIMLIEWLIVICHIWGLSIKFTNFENCMTDSTTNGMCSMYQRLYQFSKTHWCTLYRSRADRQSEWQKTFRSMYSFPYHRENKAFGAKLTRVLNESFSQ